MPRHPAEIDLEESLDDEFAFWPLNLVLLLLGTTVLGVAFFYLDARDTRIAYNPWTYVVATPMVLILISVTLNTIVSRLVQKSMQMAFLMSVLVHLFLLIGAMNIVIFSRMWPDILDALAQERHQLKREALQAKQYHYLTSSRSSSRPDYLRPAPTTHQPTEVEQITAPNLNLSRSANQSLVSPTPEVEQTAKPHLLERQNTQPAQPTMDEQSASLSRSELRQQLNHRTIPDQARSVFEPAPNRSLTPSPVAESRDRERSDTTLLTLPASEALRQPDADLALHLPATEIDRSRNTTPSDLRQAASSLPRDRSSPAGPRASRSAVQPAEAPLTPSMDANAIPEATSLALSERSNSVPQSSSVPSVSASPALPNEQPPSLPTTSLARRRDTERQTPSPAMGDTSSPLARNAAGGVTGLPAANSLPIRGPSRIAANNSSDSPLVSSRLSTARRSRDGRTQASLPGVGLPTAPSWNSQSSLSGGSSGRTPTDLSESSADGTAASPDVAQLSGAGPVMQRAEVGSPGTRGPASSPSSIGFSSSSPSGENQPSSPDGLAAGKAGVRRSSTNSSSAPPGPQNDLKPDSQLDGSSDSQLTTPNIARATGPDSAELREASEGLASRLPPRSTASQAPPANTVPSLSDRESASSQAAEPSPGDVQLSELTGGRRRSGSANLLALKQPPGVGGISPVPDRLGDVLPRRSSVPQRKTEQDFEVQRFSRQPVGGPLAAGQISVPKPAFQQRLERLQDRNPLDSNAAEPETELAIERGLAFLAKHQRENGCWRLQDFDTEVLMTSDTAATGLALLAFQGAGYTHKQFKYAETAEKAIQFLRQNQLENGDLYVKQDPASDQNAWLYSHAIAALALCEAYGMTQDRELQEPAQRAIDFMVASQDPQLGGWRYRPGTGADTSVSGWFMMAFESAELAGLQVPDETLARMQDYLNQSQVAGSPHLYRYNPYAANTPQQRHGLKPTPVMTSVGLLMRLYSGWQRDLPAMQQGASYLMTHPPEHGTASESRRDTYYWYYATQVMFHMGGETWNGWHDTLYPLLIRNQVVEGDNAGSWDPFSPTPDLWARYGGRLYVTTMNLLSLEVSYRHLPLYDATGARELTASGE